MPTARFTFKILVALPPSYRRYTSCQQPPALRVLVTVHSRVIENDASTLLPLDGSLMVKMFFDVILDLTRCLKVENWAAGSPTELMAMATLWV